ncbi:MAG: J domain-containing protein [Fimbriimonadales bacterium]|nr:J domain-containing protein [Fimbriimonadales bacterium]
MRIDPKLDAYRELGVAPNASAETIRQAYLALARRYHPDRAPAGQVMEYEERMKRINTAYEVLSNPDSRRLYDQLRTSRQQNGVLRQGVSTAGAPRAQTRDPYPQMRAGYQQRLYRIQASTHGLPPWAQALSGLFAGLGLVTGFILGLPFGIIGCIPGAMVGTVVGLLVGLWAVYLFALGLPAVLVGGLGWLVGQETGLWAGVLLGLGVGFIWARRLWRRARIYTAHHSR